MAKTADYGLGEHIFPRGWFMVGTSGDATTKPVGVRFFGEDLVLYRGASGRVFLIEAYCPHMGTHLANNSTSYVVVDKEHVEGDNIRCPYHAWRFGPDGMCNQIPYSPAPIPKKACLKSYKLVERAGCLWAWHDMEGGAPDYELPAFEHHDEPYWVNWQIDNLGLLNSHPQELLDNMTDKGHLPPVHGSMDMVTFENTFDDHVVRQYLKAGHKTLSGGDPMVNDTWYTGPGVLQSVMLGDFPSHMLIAHTPVDDGVVQVWHGLQVKTANAEPNDEDRATARQYELASVGAFSQDFEIWANKRPCLHPMMVKGDGPFDKLRIWYKQFYNPRARAHEFQARANGHYVVRGTQDAPWEDAA